MENGVNKTGEEIKKIEVDGDVVIVTHQNGVKNVFSFGEGKGDTLAGMDELKILALSGVSYEELYKHTDIISRYLDSLSFELFTGENEGNTGASYSVEISPDRISIFREIADQAFKAFYNTLGKTGK